MDRRAADKKSVPESIGSAFKSDRQMQPNATKLDAQISVGIFGPDDNECCYCEPVVQKQTDSTLNSNADAEPDKAGGQDDNGCHNSNGERTAIVVHVLGRVLRGGRHGEYLAEELDSPKRRT